MPEFLFNKARLETFLIKRLFVANTDRLFRVFVLVSAFRKIFFFFCKVGYFLSTWQFFPITQIVFPYNTNSVSACCLIRRINHWLLLQLYELGGNNRFNKRMHRLWKYVSILAVHVVLLHFYGKALKGILVEFGQFNIVISEANHLQTAQTILFLNATFELAVSFRSSHQRCSIKIGALKNFTKFTGKHLRTGVQIDSAKRLWHRCFPVNFTKFLRTPFLHNTSGRLLLFLVLGFFLNYYCFQF